MSLQWTLVAGFLYLEIFVVFILVLPFLSPKKWQSFFKSRFLQVLSNQTQWYFGFIVLILTLFLLDAIREMRKYTNKEHSEHSHLESELQQSMRLFRAQRNFYISGFSLFLSLVIRRLISLISAQATLMSDNEAIMKQAKSATHTARNLLAAQGSGEAAQNSSNEAHQQAIDKLNNEIDSLKSELDKAKKDKDAVLSQAKAVEKEYDRLNEEHRKLQLKLRVQGDEESKKDE
ncbi:B-cell receptor-associated protein 31 [Rhodnius prolixus]|uniref:Endoplasmic reticulum transmembrane protein n=1 Tax=Rhodnius prolixus TaxID=13249 RepID=R4FPZ2_RHOPR